MMAIALLGALWGMSSGAAQAATTASPTTGSTSGGTVVTVGIPKFTQVSDGGTFTVALASNDTVWAWGGNSAGSLGNGSTTDSSLPVQVTASWGNRTITQIAAGGGHALAIA